MDGKWCSVSVDGHTVALFTVQEEDTLPYNVLSCLINATSQYPTDSFCNFSGTDCSTAVPVSLHERKKPKPQSSTSFTKLYIWKSSVLTLQPPAAWCGTEKSHLTPGLCGLLVQTAAMSIPLQAVQQCRLPRLISCVLTYRASACEKHKSTTTFQ